jgi:two-component system, OmpR family, sensor histidine kinase MtrB
VFNRFWRADPSRNRRTGGTGLGLAISLEDARLHGGWLQAWGRPGAGAVFRLTLPRRQGVRLHRSPLPLAPDGCVQPGEPGVPGELPEPSVAGRPGPEPIDRPGPELIEPSVRRPPMAGVSGEAE